MSTKKKVEPIPEQFQSYEEAAEFWDTHDTTDYLDLMRSVKLVSDFRGRHYEIRIEPDVLRILKLQAKKKGVSPGDLASDVLRRHLAGS